MDRKQRIQRAMEHRSKAEAKKLRIALDTTINKWPLEEAILAGEATLKKRITDKRAEGNRRTVGARVSIDMYNRYKASANRQHISMYRWAINAFEAATRT